jgi:hypothetical protein
MLGTGSARSPSQPHSTANGEGVSKPLATVFDRSHGNPKVRGPNRRFQPTPAKNAGAAEPGAVRPGEGRQ